MVLSLVGFVRDYLFRTYRALPAADVYVLHAYHQYPAVALRAARHRARIVYDAHDFYSAGSSDVPLGAGERVVRAFHDLVERRCAAHADEIMTVSSGLAGLIEGRFGRRAVVVRNAQDRRLEQPVEASLRTIVAPRPGELLACFVGTAKDGLALAPVLEALRDVPQLQLALIGAGHERHQALVQSYGLDDRVHLLPAVPAAQVGPFIASADIAIFPYRVLTENYAVALPNGVFHALAAGLPVLYSDLPEVHRLVGAAKAGMQIDLGNPATIVAALLALVSDAELLAETRRNAAALGEATAWAVEEKRFLAVIDDVLATTR